MLEIVRSVSLIDESHNRQRPFLRCINGTDATLQKGQGERRTAAERLEESKANYMKSERVLDTRQALKQPQQSAPGSHRPHTVMPQQSGTSVYTKLPLKQIHSAPLDVPRDARGEPHRSPPDLRMARRTLQELQGFRALQQVVEAKAHLHSQYPQLYAPYVARMIPSQGQTGQQNGAHRHSSPVIPVSRRYASSSQPPLNRHPLGGIPNHTGHPKNRPSPTSSQRQSSPMLTRGSPPHGPQPTSYGTGLHGGPNGHNHSYLYHNSSSPDCLALLFGNATVAAAAGQHNASSAQSLEHQYPRTSTPHHQPQAHVPFSDSGTTFVSANLCCGPQTSTPVHRQAGTIVTAAYPNVNAVNAASTHRPLVPQALHRVPSARASRPKSPSPLPRGQGASDSVSEQHPIRRSASYTERQLRKCIGRTTEEIRDLEQQLRELIISSASIVDQPASVEEGLAEILGNRQDLAEDQDPEQDVTITSNTNNSTKDNTRNSPPSVSRSRSDTNTPPSRHSSDPERHLISTSSAVGGARGGGGGNGGGGGTSGGAGGAAKRTRSRSHAPSASSSSDSGHASRERHIQQRISRSTLPRARSASRLRPASPSSESSTDGSEYFKPRSRTTSDYISRSSSFRSPGRENSDANNVGGTRSLGRSRSDAATFASVPLSRCFKSQPNLLPPMQPFHTLEDTALFFDTLGFLDATMFTALVQPSPATTPPKFFESQSSQDSNNNSNENPSEGESEDEFRNHLASALPPVGTIRAGLSSHDLVEHAGGVIHETSIVEKNARVIKWLYNCRKSMQQSVVL
ncbi:AF4/FMR2 family member 4-like isoform X5 [Varroa destructor]|uniref:Centrosome-associated FAM110 C-terminal domain-containing protein n=1 Tax=Varroa destructor TaxID=109461 RepID=A0A7M7JC29_VARDE|nr:AF4/FMR2 family member 4-like isoform X5 [Varroa destructor]